MLTSWLLIPCLYCGQAAAGGAAAAGDAALQTQVQRLVKQLDGDTLAEREAAEKELVGLGPSILPVLAPITSRTPAEVKVRLTRIRQTLEKAAAEAAAQASLVTLHGSLPLAEALAAIQQQTGNKLIDLREKFGQQRTNPAVTVDFDKTPFWQALDQLLDQVNLTVYAFGGEPGAVAVVARSEEEQARAKRAAYSGLFRFEGLRIQATRDLRNPKNQSLRLGLEVTWEPRTTPILLQVPLADLQATDERGGKLTVESRAGNLEVPVESALSAVELQLPLSLPARDVQKIATLRGSVVALVPGRLETFEFSDLENAKEVVQRRAGVTVTLEQVRKNVDVYELRLRVRFDKAENALESHRGWIYANEAYLLDAAGKRLDHAGLQAFRQAADEVGVAYLLDPDRGLKGLKFVYQTPAMLVKMPVTFELQDLPLP